MKSAVCAHWKGRLLFFLAAIPCLSLAIPLLTAASALAAVVGQATAIPPLVSQPPSIQGEHWQRIVNSPSSVVLFAKTDHSCHGWRRAWRTSHGTGVELAVWTCQYTNDASVALWNLLFLQGKNNGSSFPYFHPAGQPDFWAESASGPSINDGHETVISYSRSRYFVIVDALAPDTSAYNALALATLAASQEAGQLPGPTSHLTAPPLFNKATSELASTALVVYLIMLLPLRAWRNPLSGQSYQTRGGDARWYDMTPEAGRLKWLLRLRSLARLIFYLSCAGALTQLLTHQTPISLIVSAAISAWFAWIRPVGRSLRRWKIRRVRGLSLTKTPFGWLELAFALTSLACVICALIIILLALIIYSYGFANSPLVVDGILDPRYLSITAKWQQGIVALLVGIRSQDLFEISGILIFLFLGAAALLRRFGRRFALADAVRAQERDSRPPILYLRNFSDDVLTMPSSSLARTSLIERLSIVNRQPFEEILVRHLSAKGPVVALSHPSSRLPAIGAARLTLPNDKWQEQIRTWIAKAQMVVVAVTPPRMSEGLYWEIEYLAQCAAVPVVLVFSPYKERDLMLRWWQFATEAAKLPRFGELSRYLEHNSGAHFMAQRPGFGWVTWGARKRSEFTYAACWWEASLAAEEYRHAVQRHLGDDPQRSPSPSSELLSPIQAPAMATKNGKPSRKPTGAVAGRHRAIASRHRRN
jgi:hypothetical protein